MDPTKDVLQSGYPSYVYDYPYYQQHALQNGVAAGSCYATPKKKSPLVDSSMVSTAAALSASKPPNTIQLKRVESAVDSSGYEWMIQIGTVEYKVYGGRLITMEEAEWMHDKLLDDHTKGMKKLEWTEEEIKLLQWVVFNYSCQNNKPVFQFSSMDWEKVATMVPGRNKSHCRSRWLKTQNIKVNKSSWTEQEDLILKNIVEDYGAKHWTAVAARFNKLFPNHERTRKQCRDRWLNYLNPDISKAEITASEELHLFCYWQQLGNKWVEIARLMGRAENWVKNNWKKVLKREGIALDKKLQENVAKLIQKLRGAVTVEEKPKTVNHCEGSSQDIPGELSVSDSEGSKYGTSEFFSEAPPSEYLPPAEEEKMHPMMKPWLELDSEPIISPDSQLESIIGTNKAVVLNTESEDYDFSANTYERRPESQFMDVDVPDIQRYTIPSHEKSPFHSYKRNLI